MSEQIFVVMAASERLKERGRVFVARSQHQREAHAIATLQHPHICTLYDVGSQDGTDFLVMEYLDGETLAAPPA